MSALLCGDPDLRAWVHRRGSSGLPRTGAGQDALAELVELARAGDLDAFSSLVECTTPACYSLAFRLVGNEHDARDVVQDAYLRAFRGLRRFRGDAAFQTWLHRITVNCATTHMRRRAKTSHDRLEDLVDPRHLVDPRLACDPEATAGSRDERSRLVEALAELPDQLRLVVVLRDVYDLPHREIALELGISQSAAKVRLHRARRRLRERLFPARHAVVGAPGDPTTAPPGAMTAGPPGAMTAAPRAGCLVAEAGSPRDGSLQDKAGAA